MCLNYLKINKLSELKYLLLFSFLFFFSGFSSGASITGLTTLTSHSEGMKLKLDLVFEGLGIPWGMAFISSNQLLITERHGNVSLLNLKSLKKIQLKNIPAVYASGQAGMLDVVLSPNYKTDGWIYFTYVKELKNNGVTVLARAKLNGQQLKPWQDLLISKSATSTDYHFGSRITFDAKGHVFFSIGDRGVRTNSQDLTNHAGTILRLNLDGSVPKDNPFVGNKNVLPEIWSYGHRNPQGLSYDLKNKRLWSIEHGPRGGDEINLIVAKANYGWPVISYGKEYWGPLAVGEGTHKKGLQQPVKMFDPSIAPGSLLFYNGKALSKWNGNLISGALKLQHLNRIVLNTKTEVIKEERLFETMHERIRALVQSPEGWIFFSTDSGKIYKLYSIK